MPQTRSVRLPAAERREKIVTKASQLFANKGFEGTTTRAIADACGVSEATIFRHFETKEDLYDAIIRSHVERRGNYGLTEELATSADDRTFFLAFARGFLHHSLADRDFWRLLIRSALENHSLSTHFFETHVNEGMTRLAGDIERRQLTGGVRHFDPKSTAWLFVGMLAHYLNSIIVFRRDPFADRTIDDVAAFVVDVFLHGVTTS